MNKTFFILPSYDIAALTFAGIVLHSSSEMEATDILNPFASGTAKIPDFCNSFPTASGSLQGMEIKNPESNGTQ